MSTEVQRRSKKTPEPGLSQCDAAVPSRGKDPSPANCRVNLAHLSSPPVTPLASRPMLKAFRRAGHLRQVAVKIDDGELVAVLLMLLTVHGRHVVYVGGVNGPDVSLILAAE